MPGWFLFFFGGAAAAAAAAPGAAAAAEEFCCREGCICVSPSPKKGADEAVAIGRKQTAQASFFSCPL